MTERVAHASIQEALLAIGEEVGPIAKRVENVQSQFRARGIDDVLDAFHAPMIKHGVTVQPTYEVLDSKYINTKNQYGDDKVIHAATVKGTFTFGMVVEGRDGPTGQAVQVSAIGHSTDYADKAFNQAQSQSLKMAFLQAFVVPIGEPDAEATSIEMRPTAATDRPGPPAAQAPPSLRDTVARAARPAPAPQGDRPVTMVNQAQGRNLYRLWYHKLGWDKSQYLTEVENHVGVAVDDDRNLTKDQASAMIEHLKRLAGEPVDSPRPNYVPASAPSEPAEEIPNSFDDEEF